MPTFPILSTGAVAQYPLPLTSAQGVQTIRFLDGTDQRFLMQGRTFRRWEIQLELLTDDEMAQLETFFTEQGGDYSTFTFPDPYSGVDVPNCRFGTPTMMAQYLGVDVSSTSLWVLETNG